LPSCPQVTVHPHTAFIGSNVLEAKSAVQPDGGRVTDADAQVEAGKSFGTRLPTQCHQQLPPHAATPTVWDKGNGQLRNGGIGGWRKDLGTTKAAAPGSADGTATLQGHDADVSRT